MEHLPTVQHGTYGTPKPSDIGVLFGWFAYKIEGPGLDGVNSIYQGNPSIFPASHLCQAILEESPCGGPLLGVP